MALMMQGRRTTSTSATPLSSSMRSGKVSSGRLATGSSTLGMPEALRGYILLPAEPASSTAEQGGICSMGLEAAMAGLAMAGMGARG